MDAEVELLMIFVSQKSNDKIKLTTWISYIVLLPYLLVC